MSNFSQSQKDQAWNKLRAVESIRLLHQRCRGNNLAGDSRLGSRAEQEMPSNSQAATASNFPSTWLVRSGRVSPVTGQQQERTAVELGGGSNLVAQTKSAATGAESRGSRRQTDPRKVCEGESDTLRAVWRDPESHPVQGPFGRLLEAICL